MHVSWENLHCLHIVNMHGTQNIKIERLFQVVSASPSICCNKYLKILHFFITVAIQKMVNKAMKTDGFEMRSSEGSTLTQVPVKLQPTIATVSVYCADGS